MCLSFNLLATFWLMAIYHWKNDETCELGHLDGDLTEMICNPNGHSFFEKTSSAAPHACLF